MDKEMYLKWKNNTITKLETGETKVDEVVRKITKSLKELQPFILEETNHLPEDASWNERLYHLYHDLNYMPVCEICGNKVRYKTFNQGYLTYCSKECGGKATGPEGLSDESRQQLSESQKKVHEERGDEIIAAREDTYEERTGFRHQMHNPNVKKDVSDKTKGKPKKEKPEEDTSNKIQCQMCGDYLRMITTQHLNKCSGITLNEYKERFPESEIIIEELKEYRRRNCRDIANRIKTQICPECGKETEVGLNLSDVSLCDDCRKNEKYPGQTYIEEKDLVVCQICFRGLNQITESHVQREHGITMEEYRTRFPDCPVTNQRLLNGRRDNWLGEKHTEESIKKMSESHLYTTKDYEEKYPWVFHQIEEIKDGESSGEIYTRCKNHECPNSKEQDGWFLVSRSQLQERIKVLNNPDFPDGAYLYCSDECKKECPLYKLKVEDLFSTKIERNHTDGEYNVWRNEVLRRDNYICIGCGSKDNLRAHHVTTIKHNKFLSLDPENGITLCEECHKKIGHSGECSIANLRKLKC